ncbi:MAG TPA: glutamate synthase large subunit [Candidatus Hydrogenedentes bacterium]|mgnify:CR=1 FL=1|nr:glutamate synthase large subunit [Candidatus Hydrogenedentota bacterium]HPG66218.1 glutamate synthase large subunit [Candidatus Hydrogenedentota bacterium]
MRSISPKGCYDPRYEHDACGVGFVVNIDGTQSHQIIAQGIQVLENLVHRGASGCDPDTGDGAGMLVQIPHAFFADEAESLGFDLAAPGAYAVGMVFLPQDTEARATCKGLFGKVVADEGQTLLGWREVPRDSSAIGWLARDNEPVIEQVFVRREQGLDPDGFARKLLVIRKVVENGVRALDLNGRGQFYVSSLSPRTICYKGLMLAHQMARYYPDLSDVRFESALALVHQRYSTNTLPTWPLAQPFRYLAHNGEINTLRGNINMMASREQHFRSPLFGENIKKLMPVLTAGASDSAIFDNALEMLALGGRSISHAMAMMIPEPWGGHESMADDKKAFYEYHACLMEPWDGPASMVFTDGLRIGAVLDRNGLRPSRYWVTKDDFVVMASEVGVLDIPQADIIKKGRLEPGRMFLIDTQQGRIVDDAEIKQGFALMRPYRRWLDMNRKPLPEGLHETERIPERAPLLTRQQVFGYTAEDLEIVMAPMAQNGKEPVGSMGNDAPLAVLSRRPQLLFNYFKQLFAQVTNPPIDPIREEIVMSLETTIGREGNILDETPDQCRQLFMRTPILRNAELKFIRALDEPGLKAHVISTLFPAAEGPDGLGAAVDRICTEASAAIADGATILILSDRGVDRDRVPIPSLLATGAVHQHLVREQTRTECGIVVESGEPREVMHFALLTGFGAGAVNPYLAFETVYDLLTKDVLHLGSIEEAVSNYIHAVEKGLLKVMSKIGISTQHSYRNAQIFEAVGLSSAFVDRFFTGTVSRVEGIGLDEVARETLMRYAVAYPPQPARKPSLDPGGQYRWRKQGEFHQFGPETIATIQRAVRTNDWGRYQEFAATVNDRNRTLATLRGLLQFKKGTPIPIDEVESVDSIVKRFCTGAMSFGSISKEAHETLAIAMNRLGGRSNTGEGGEDPARFEPDANGDLRRSAIKQVASGRFGVTNEYLVNADELQIKMAQGAKPGEGGQLPGHKVLEPIAKVRYSTPGVELISPPPHHDIYSIEDLAQLIHDLKNANVYANVSVKLVSAVGVGTIAAGVAKGKADLVLISGHDGGTGASPLTSIKHAGVPWELGLAEAHQVLVENNLRSRITVQVDGQLKTGRDVAIGALLGADEFGFATMPLVCCGCIMMRKCHQNTCPVGVATQDPELRKNFRGKPEYVVNYFRFVAQELREIMAELGFRTVQEMTGRSDMLEFDPLPDHWKAKTLDLAKVLYVPTPWEGETLYKSKCQDHGIDRALDHEIMVKAKPAIENRAPVRFPQIIRNTHRTVATMLSSELTRRHKLGMYSGHLSEDTVWIDCQGAAGQSFGAFAIRGVTLYVEGEANDYLGKGLSGAKIIVRPPRGFEPAAEENILVGNVVLYGATSGECYIRGVAGERFCVRNSGAWAVVEGVGDHGCEYMTGGRVAVLGRTGRNFAAGMSGGIAYVYDPNGTFPARCNLGMVDLKPLHRESIPTLKSMIERHYQYTESPVAKHVLEKWRQTVDMFVRVMPRDYARVLSEQRAKGHTGR